MTLVGVYTTRQGDVNYNFSRWWRSRVYGIRVLHCQATISLNHLTGDVARVFGK